MKQKLYAQSLLRNARHLCMTVLVLGLSGYPVRAQLDDLMIAKDLAYHSKYAEADALFNLILARDGQNMDALLGRAYNHSWNDHLQQAQVEFEHILEMDPSNKDALIGLGYTLAWAEDYHAAIHPFFIAQQFYPNDPEVIKGQAYVYLWQQKPFVARDLFERLKNEDPGNIEYYIALAYANLQLFETREARNLLARALVVAPNNISLHELKQSLKKATPLMEVDIWSGYTSIDNTSKFGLRSIGLSVQATQKLRPFLIYDNSLSLDNLGFLLNKEAADTYYAGGIYSWNKNNTSRLQIGYRDYTAVSDGFALLAEHNVNFHERVTGKFGGLYSTNVDGTSAWMLYTGAHVPLSKQWSVEPIYYLTRPSSGESAEHRITTSLQYSSPFGLEWSFGGLYGSVNGITESGTTSTYGGHTMLVLPVHRSIWLQGVFRYEHGAFGNFLIATAGIKLRIEK